MFTHGIFLCLKVDGILSLNKEKNVSFVRAKKGKSRIFFLFFVSGLFWPNFFGRQYLFSVSDQFLSKNMLAISLSTWSVQADGLLLANDFVRTLDHPSLNESFDGWFPEICRLAVIRVLFLIYATILLQLLLNT